MSGTVCCYSGCKKSYSTDKDVSFFKFPSEEKLRAKWMKNCGNLELQSLSERQLRGKRICSDHFSQNSFIRPESRTALTDAAVPVPTKGTKKTNETAVASPSLVEKKVVADVTDTAAKKDQATPTRGRKGKESVSNVNVEPDQSPERPVRGRRTRSEQVPAATPPVTETKPDQKSSQASNTKKDNTKTVAKPTSSAAEDENETEAAQVEVTPKRTAADKKRKTPESVAVATPETQSSKQRVTRGKRTRADVESVNQEPQTAEDKSDTVEETKESESQDSSIETPTVSTVTNSPKKTQITSDRKRKGADSIGSVEQEASNERPLRGKRTRNEVDSVVKIVNAPSEPTTENPADEPVAKPVVVAKKGTPAKVTVTPKVTPVALTSIAQEVSTDDATEKKQASPTKKKKATPVAGTVMVAKGQDPKKSDKIPEKSPAEKTIMKQTSKPTVKVAASSASPAVSKVTTKKLSPVKTAPVSTKKAEQMIFQAVLKQEQFIYESSRNDVEDDGIDENEILPDGDEEPRTDLEFERFYASLKKYLLLPGRWTLGGVQWDPQGRRKVIVISEPEIPHNGKPCVKRCLQCFEDKSIRVFIDKMDMTDVFGMAAYADKEDIAGIINRIAESSTCSGVPKMVEDDLKHFPTVRKRNCAFFAENCPGVIPNDAFDPVCSACKDLQGNLLESRENEKKRLLERRIRSNEKNFSHPFGEALYSLFDDLADETDPTKPRKKRTKETFFRKFLHDTRMKVAGDPAKTERVYIEKPISVDSVSQSFQDIVSKLGFNMPNTKKRPSGGLLPRPTPSTSTPRPSTRVMPIGTSSLMKMDRKLSTHVEHILPFTPGSSITLDDGQEYELIGEVEPGPEFVEMKPTVQQQQQFEIIEVDDETLARLTTSKNQVVVLPESANASILPVTTRIDANDPNLSQILKAINTSHGFKVL